MPLVLLVVALLAQTCSVRLAPEGTTDAAPMVRAAIARVRAAGGGEVRFARGAMFDSRMVVDANRVVRGWMFNEVEDFKPYGDVLAAMHDGHAGVRIVSKGKPTAIYHATVLPAKAGERLDVSARVRGRGQGTVGFFCYGKNWTWKGSVGQPQTVAATAADEPVEICARMTVPADVVSVRPFLSVSSGDEVEFYDIAVERNAKR